MMLRLTDLNQNYKKKERNKEKEEIKKIKKINSETNHRFYQQKKDRNLKIIFFN